MTGVLVNPSSHFRSRTLDCRLGLCFRYVICTLLAGQMVSEGWHTGSSSYAFSLPYTAADDSARQYQQLLERYFPSDRESKFLVVHSQFVDAVDDSNSAGQRFIYQDQNFEPFISECFRLEGDSGCASYVLSARLAKPPSGERFVLVNESVARDQYGLLAWQMELSPGFGKDGRIPDRLFSLLSEQKAGSVSYRNKAHDKYLSFVRVTSSAKLFGGFLKSSGEIIDLRSEDFMTEWTVVQEVDGQVTLSHKRLPAKLTFVEQRLSRVEYQDGDSIVELDSFEFGSNEAVAAFRSGTLDVIGTKSLCQLISVTPEIDDPWFEVFRVVDGTPVYDDSERNLYREIRGQAAVFVVDEDAKDAISRQLATNGGTIKSQSQNESREVQLVQHLSVGTTNRLCGLYSISFAAAALGVDVPAEKLVTSSTYLSHREGSSASDLMRVAEDHGLESWFVSNASVTMLRQHNGPSLLRMREPSGTVGHWVVLCGFDEQGRAVIVDLPEQEILLEEADLLTYWDSQAILLGNTPIESQMIVRGRFEQFLPAILVMVLLAAVRVMGSSAVRWPWQVQFLAFLGAGLGLAVVWQCASPASYLNNPGPVRFVTSSRLEPHKIIYQLPESLDSFQLIDCRMPADYHAETFGNAINLPINARFAAFRRITASLPAEKPVIVFCQSTQCDWADTVATKLSASGFRDVSVYRPGFVGMVDRQEEK